MFRLGDDLRIPLIASAVFVAHVLLGFALIPPWQQPDEPTFVAWAEWRRARFANPAAGPEAGREGEIIQSMAHHWWWQHRGETGRTLERLPKDFGPPGTGTPASSPGRPPAYPWTAGGLLSALPQLPVVQTMYLLRAVSAVAGLATLWVAWLAGREALGMLGGAGIAFVLAVHPQFAIVSTAASSDALANLLAACAWWQIVRIVRGRHALASAAAMWTAVIAASLFDRMAMPVVVAASVATALALWWFLGPRRAMLAAAVAAGGGVVALVIVWQLGLVGTSLRSYQFDVLFSAGFAPDALTWDFFAGFTEFLHRSWWFSLGWGRYRAPSWWAWVFLAVTIIATCGVVRQIGTRRIDARVRILAAVAVLALAVQVAAVYWMYYRVAIASQGKSLFPALFPCLLILWIGLTAWVPERHRPHAAAAFVSLLALFDLSVWTLVAIPAYYASF